MSDFCHEFDPGGLGCPHPELDEGFTGDSNAPHCPEHCLGDFHWALTSEVVHGLDVGFELLLGICEGHGTAVYLHRDDEGYWFEHGPADPDEPRREEEKIPERKKVTLPALPAKEPT